MNSSFEISAGELDGRPGTTIRSVERIADILELLARESRGLPLGEIAARLQLNASTTHHLLATLKARGLVAQDERSKSYRIGYRLVALTNRFLAGTDLYAAGIGPMEALRDRSGEMSYLSVFQGQEVAAIIALTGQRPIQARRSHHPGQSSLHCTASGKLLLAYLPSAAAEALLAPRELARFTPHTLTTLDDLRAELDTIRERGYALDREEDYVGVECVAAPVFDGNGECVASASVSYPAAPPARTKELIALVLDTAASISANLGAAPVQTMSLARPI
jgi:DNA-binding IclR family transcriptional regulator